MARLTVQLGGSLVVPIEVLRRYPMNWRTRAFDEARLAVLMWESDIATVRRVIRASGGSEASPQGKIDVGEWCESAVMGVLDAASFGHRVNVSVCASKVAEVMPAVERLRTVPAV